MKFIHFADAHLDSPFRGLSFLPSKAFNQIYRASDESLTKIIDLALQEQVDLVLIAGDTFDSTHPSPRSQLFFAEQIKRLTDAEIQVVMIFGNHDHMPEADLLVNSSPYFKLLGPNQQVEAKNFVTKSGFNYRVVGFSYLNNHIVEDKLPEFPAKDDRYTFGIMHAQEKTSTNSQNVYAPFTLAEIKDLNYDYFALGHIHLRQIISHEPLAVFPGNIQGRHINELGAKGCYLGKIDEETKQTKLEFHPTSPIVWQSVDVHLTEAISKNDLRDRLQSACQPQQTTYYSIRLHGAELLNDEEIDLVQDNSFWPSLPFDSQIVDLRFVTEEKMQLGDSDQESFEQAQKEIFSKKEFLHAALDWAKKDPVAEKAASDDQFRQEVEALAKIKLSQKLKGFADETETD